MLTFEGKLTLKHADEIRASLIKALIDAGHVEIDIGNVIETDLSCVQLLCSAHRTSLKLNKRLNFIGRLPKHFREAAEAAGYSRSSGCTKDCEQSCLWIAH
jgi:anti-anti-sigma regulatory factor